MHSPVQALNWQIWSQHRWGLAGALLIVAGICAMPQAYPPARLTSDIGNTGMPVMMAILMPFGFVILDRLLELPAREQLQHLRKNAAYFH